MSSSLTPGNKAKGYQGNDVALVGIVLGVLTFWLFGATPLNIAPQMGADLNIGPELMNVAIAITALFSGMLIVVAGSVADRVGRVRMAIIGNVVGIVGSLLIALAFSSVAAPMLLVGRALQGVCAACIMPSTMALLKTYWHGKDRQRAVSIWSMGSWGGGGFAALVGGVMASSMFGWRSIFFVSALVSVISILLIRQIPEDAPQKGTDSRLDWPGIISLALAVLTLLIVVTQGDVIGWGSWIVWALAAVSVLAAVAFFMVERRTGDPLVDFSIFSNRIFTGATVSNFLVNATAGLIPVSLWVLQRAGGVDSATTGYITIGYAVFILLFIRVGEKLMQRVGARQPMVVGTVVVSVAACMLMTTNLMRDTYIVLAVIAFCLFGIGLALYATPSTDAALTSLDDAKAGAGSGVYKMASSLGAAFGAAIPTAIFTAVESNGGTTLSQFISFMGRQDNVVIREAGIIAMSSILVMALIALVSIVVYIPARTGKKDKAHAE